MLVVVKQRAAALCHRAAPKQERATLASLVDPFLKGDVAEFSSLTSAWLRGHEHLVSNILAWTTGLSADEWWYTPALGFNPAAALVRHIGGASMRLWCYASAAPLPVGAREEAATELAVDFADHEQLLETAIARLSAVRQGIESFDTTDLGAIRFVGGKRIPVPAVHIVHHLLEHGHAHAGQLAVMRRLVMLKRES